MTAQIQRAILKGHLFGTVSTRNMFTADVNLVSPETFQAVWEEYLTGVLTTIMGYFASAMSIDTLEIQYQSGSTWFPVSETPFIWAGTASGDTLANVVASVLIGKVAGSHSVGRKFFSGLGEMAVNGNSLTTAALAAFGVALAAYVTPITTVIGSTLSPGIVDKGGTFRIFISGFVSSLLGTMRRRKPGLGI